MATGGERSESRVEVTVDDLVLAVLFAEAERPVNGGLMLMKLLFLVGKEIDPRFDSVLSFFPKDFGPYSRRVAQSLKRLVNGQLVDSRRNLSDSSDFERTDFSLTPQGLLAASEAFHKLDPGTRVKLSQLRRGAEELGYSGILRYVYSKYPEYADLSKIREEVEVDY